MASKSDNMTRTQARAAWRNLFGGLFVVYAVWLAWRRLISEPDMGVFFTQLLIGAVIFGGLYGLFWWLAGQATDGKDGLVG